MSAFTPGYYQEVAGKRRAGRKVYSLHGLHGEGVWLHIGYSGSGLALFLPEGYETDGPSGLPQWLVDMFPDLFELLIWSSGAHDRARENTLFSKLESDAIFWMAMEAEGTPEVLRELAFAAVRTNDSRSRHNPDDLVFDVEMPPY